jgi:hypothetical protein
MTCKLCKASFQRCRNFSALAGLVTVSWSRRMPCVLNAQRGHSNVVFLTQLGGGAFGNDASWIEAAMARALRSAADWGLVIKLVSFGEPPPRLRKFVQELA